MAKVNELKSHLKRGKVYRRQDLEKFSTSVDRHLEMLVSDGTLEKLTRGLYYYPKQSVFGKTPPDEKDLVSSFLNDDRFLLTSLNNYNMLGVGTTQLYNTRIVYNHKQHRDVKLGNKVYSFRVKHNFPKKMTEEFLIVDLVNNLDTLAEDKKAVLERVFAKVNTMDLARLKKCVAAYGNVSTRKLLNPVLKVSNDGKLFASS